VRGKAIFDGKTNCASCHVPPLFTEPGNNLHAPSEIGVDSWQADRSPTQCTGPLPLRVFGAIRKVASIMMAASRLCRM